VPRAGPAVRARLVRIMVEHREGLLHINVTDDGGRGADISAGSGLLGLRDRVSALDGTLTRALFPDRGTCVSAIISSGQPADGNGRRVMAARRRTGRRSASCWPTTRI